MEISGRLYGHRPWPALEGGHGEQRHHALQNIVEVKLAVLPYSLGPFRFPNISILIHNVGTPAGTQIHACPSACFSRLIDDVAESTECLYLHSA